MSSTTIVRVGKADRAGRPVERDEHLGTDPAFANGLLTELRKTGRNRPTSADIPIRETPAQTPFPVTHHRQKNGKGRF